MNVTKQQQFHIKRLISESKTGLLLIIDYCLRQIKGSKLRGVPPRCLLPNGFLNPQFRRIRKLLQSSRVLMPPWNLNFV